MKLKVDQDLCIGCGLCEDTCPEAFRMDDDGYARPIVENPDPELYGCCRDASDACPVAAISIEE